MYTKNYTFSWIDAINYLTVDELYALSGALIKIRDGKTKAAYDFVKKLKQPFIDERLESEVE